MKGSYFVNSTKKKSSSLSEARRLTKKISTDMAKMVNDLTELRKVTEELKNTFDSTLDVDVADRMYAFYNEVADLEEHLDETYYDFKHMYEELGDMDTIPSPKTIS